MDRGKGRQPNPVGIEASLVYHSGMRNALDLETVRLSDDGRSVIILDQTLLPGKAEYRELRTPEEIWTAIKNLQVRGAPAIGVAAACGIAAVMQQENGSFEEASRRFSAVKAYLETARPTAYNLFWALDRMEKVLKGQTDTEGLKKALIREAEAIRSEDIAISRSIGELGFSLLRHGDGILTHCNAGSLATAKYGTALAPVYIALEHGWNDIRVYCDETRPLLQGARLTAFEMQSAGIDTTLICDSMASYVMKKGLVDIVIVGCDRVAANGDAANKIGTSGVAVLAHHYGIPFFVAAPSSTIDMSISSGAEIPVEERSPEEVTEMWYSHRMAPEGVKVLNPAFDVTDSSLITGIITERGIAYPPFGEAFMEMLSGGM